jgi:hypothetical protein
VEIFSRKLSKQIKVFENTSVMKLDSMRNLLTKHRLHTNNKGKETATKTILSTVKYMLKKQKNEFIWLWKEGHVREIQETHNSQEH